MDCLNSHSAQDRIYFLNCVNSSYRNPDIIIALNGLKIKKNKKHFRLLCFSQIKSMFCVQSQNKILPQIALQRLKGLGWFILRVLTRFSQCQSFSGLPGCSTSSVCLPTLLLSSSLLTSNCQSDFIAWPPAPSPLHFSHSLQSTA